MKKRKGIGGRENEHAQVGGRWRNEKQMFFLLVARGLFRPFFPSCRNNLYTLLPLFRLSPRVSHVFFSLLIYAFVLVAVEIFSFLSFVFSSENQFVSYWCFFSSASLSNKYQKHFSLSFFISLHPRLRLRLRPQAAPRTRPSPPPRSPSRRTRR